MSRRLPRRLLVPAVLACSLAAVPASAQFSFLGLQNNLIEFVLDQISVPGEFEISAERVEEGEEGSTDLVGLTIADADGVWLRVGRASLAWTPSQILRGNLFIDRLAASDVDYLRAPGASVEVKEDAEAAQDDGELFDWPRAPIDVEVEELRLDDFTASPGTLAEQGFSINATGSARDWGDIQALDLEVTRTAAVAGTIRVDYERDFEADTLNLDLLAEENAGGLVAEIAGLPAGSATSARVDASGPLTDWTLDLAVTADEVIALDGGARVDLTAPIEVRANLEAEPGGQLDPGVARLLAPRATLDVAVVEGEDGIIRIQSARIDSPEITFAANGFYDQPGERLDLDVRLDASPGLAEGAEGVSFAALGLDGNVQGPLDGLQGNAEIRVEGLASSTADVETAAVTATFETTPEVARVNLDGDGRGLRLDRLGPDILETFDLLGRAVYEIEPGVARLNVFRLDTGPLDVRAEGVVDTGGNTLDLRYEIVADRIAEIAAAYEQEARGDFRMQGAVDGPLDAPTLDGTIALTGLAYQGEEYGEVDVRHVATFDQDPDGRLTVNASGSRYGPAEVATRFVLDGDVLTLDELRVAALDAMVTGQLDLNTASTLATGEIEIDVPSLDAAQAATGLELQGSGGGTITLDVEEVEQAFGTTERQQVAALDLAFRDFRGFEASVARVAIDGRVRDVLETPTGDLTFTVENARHPQGALDSATIEARAERLMRRGTLDLDLTVEGAEATDAARVARLTGTAQIRDIEASPSADFDLTAQDVTSDAVEGGARLSRLTLDGTARDLTGAISGEARAVAEAIEAAGYAVDDLTLDTDFTDVLEGGTVDGTLTVRGVDGPDARLARAEADFEVTDPTGAPAATLDLTAQDIAAADVAIASMTANASTTDLTGSPSVEATATLASIDGAGVAVRQVDLTADLADVTGTGSGTAEVVATGLSGAAEARRITVDADMSGLTDPAGTIRVRTDGLSAGGVGVGEARLDARLIDRGETTAVDATLAAPTLSTGELTVTGTELRAEIADALGTPVLDVALTLDGVDGAPVTVENPRLTVEGPLSRLDVALDAAGEYDRRPLDVGVRARADVEGPLAVTVSTLDATLGDARVGLDQPLVVRTRGSATELRDLALSLPGGRIAGQATLYQNGAAGDLAGDFDDLGRLDALAEDLPLTAGRLDLDTAFDTRPGSAGATIDGDASGLVFEDALADVGGLGATIDGDWDGRRLDASLRVTGDFGDPVAIEAGVPLRPTGEIAPALVETAPLSASVEWEGRIDRLWALVPAPDSVLDGDATIDVQVSGTPAAPEIGGTFELADGQYQNLETGTILTDVEIDTEFAGTDRVVLSLDARDGAGGTVTGRVALDGATLDASIEADGAVLVRRDDVTARISADIAAEGPLTGFDVSGEVVIDRAEIRLVNATPPSVASLGEVRIKGEPIEEEEASGEGAIGLDLAIRAPNDVFVRGRGLDSEWEIDLEVDGTASDPRITGTVERIRGVLDFLGKRFDLEEGQVTFTGGQEIDPRLNVALAHTNDGVTGFVRVEGTASEPVIRFTSDPALPESEVLPRTVFGQSSQSLSPAEALQLANAVATLLDGSGGTFDQIRSAVGVDVLRIDTTASGGAALTVGRNVGDNVFIGASQPIDGSETEVVVEVEVFGNVSVDGQVESDGSTSLGVNWRRDF
ncbi:MAG: translocation/assembly module TamB domain-containing protein [Paracoccaceae bacterium]